MIYKPIVVVAGEPNSIFSEIFFKSLNYKKFKSPIILISSHNLIKLQMKKLNMSKKIKLINILDIKKNYLDNKTINLIDVSFNQRKPFEKISSKSNEYLKKSFDIALKILEKKNYKQVYQWSCLKEIFFKKKVFGSY